VIFIFVFEEMREILDQRLPEVTKTEEHAELLRFWGDSEIPQYCYYELLEHLFIDLITGKLHDEPLLNRVIVFMEDMANSEDREVANLVQVQVLEGLFCLDHDVFIQIESMLLPNTTKLLEQTKQWFYEPNGSFPDIFGKAPKN
jgi:hypothetical protein